MGDWDSRVGGLTMAILALSLWIWGMSLAGLSHRLLAIWIAGLSWVGALWGESDRLSRRQAGTLDVLPAHKRAAPGQQREVCPDGISAVLVGVSVRWFLTWILGMSLVGLSHRLLAIWIAGLSWVGAWLGESDKLGRQQAGTFEVLSSHKCAAPGQQRVSCLDGISAVLVGAGFRWFHIFCHIFAVLGSLVLPVSTSVGASPMQVKSQPGVRKVARQLPGHSWSTMRRRGGFQWLLWVWCGVDLVV